MSHPECEQFTPRKRAICRGEAGLPLEGAHGTNAYRADWGLPPLSHGGSQTAGLSLPPLVIRGWNFAQAIVRWTLAGMPRRTQEEIDNRLAICQSCEFLENHHCTKCGCACVETNRLINKLALTTEKCPVGKWQ